MEGIVNIRERFQRLESSFRKTMSRFPGLEETDDVLDNKNGGDVPKPNMPKESTGHEWTHLNRLISYCRSPFSRETYDTDDYTFTTMNYCQRARDRILSICDDRIESAESCDDIDECIAQFKLRQRNNDRKYSSDDLNVGAKLSKADRRVSKVSVVTVLSDDVTLVRETTTTLVQGITRQSRGDLRTKFVSTNDRMAPQPSAAVAQNTSGMIPDLSNNCTNIYDDAFFNTAPCLKISLQYFSSGNQLRVLLLKTRDLDIRGGSIISKCTLLRAAHKKRTRSLKGIPTSRKAKLNQEVLFDNVQINSNTEWSLRIRLYFKRWFLSKKTCLGETSLSLSQLDLFMNTTFWCILNPKSASKQDAISHGSNFKVLYRDQTIQAHAKASLSTTDLFSTTSSTTSLHLSRTNLRRIDTDPLVRKNIR